MRMPIASNHNRLLPRPIAHPRKPTMRIIMRNLICIDQVQPLLQIHARAEGFLACAGEHRAAELGLGIVPFPQSAELDGRFDGEAVHVGLAVDGDEEDVFGGEGDEGVRDVWVGVFEPGGDGVGGAGGGHFGGWGG